VLKEERESRLPALGEVEAKVRAALEREKQLELARRELAAARAQLGAGKSMAEVAQGLGLEAQESAEFGRGENLPGLGAAPAVVDAALALEVGQIGGPLDAPGGGVLFEVLERQRFDPIAGLN